MQVVTTATSGLNVRGYLLNSGSIVDVLRPGEVCDVLTRDDAARPRLGVYGEALDIRTPRGRRGQAAAWWLKEAGATIPIPGSPGVRFGAHGSVHPGLWPYRDGQLAARFKAGRLESATLLVSDDMDGSAVTRLAQEGVAPVNQMGRLFRKFDFYTTPRQFVDAVLPAAMRVYAAGVRVFAAGNEQNLHTKDAPEGFGVVWADGVGAGQWTEEANALLQAHLPQAILCCPPVSPGADFWLGGKLVRADSTRFLQQAAPYITRMRGMWHHFYWQGASVEAGVESLRRECAMFPHLTHYVTEFSNTSSIGLVGWDTKVAQLLHVLTLIRGLQYDIRVATFFTAPTPPFGAVQAFPDEAVPAHLFDRFAVRS